MGGLANGSIGLVVFQSEIKGVCAHRAPKKAGAFGLPPPGLKALLWHSCTHGAANHRCCGDGLKMNGHHRFTSLVLLARLLGV